MTRRKMALVTGGSRGLGKDMAINIARKGIDVIITYHTNKSAAEAVVAEIEKTGSSGFALPLDSSNTKGFDTFYSKLSDYLVSKTGTPRVDFLIHNSGTGIYQPFHENHLRCAQFTVTKDPEK